MTDDNIGSLEQQALLRKARLQNLKRRHTDSNEKDTDVNNLPKPQFRSYKPQDESLLEKKLDDTIITNLDEKVQDQLQCATSNTIEDFNINNLAPRKPDWDLKRDASKKLEKLERRTEKAIAELIREHLKSKQHDLATAVNLATESIK